MAHLPASPVPVSNAPASDDAARPDGQRLLAMAAIAAAGLVLVAGLGAWAAFGPAVAFEMMTGAIWNCF